MKKLLPLATFIFSISQAYGACVPAKVVVEYPENAPSPGMYHRVHPSGNYVMASGVTNSYEYGVAIIDLTKKDAAGKIQAKLVKTPMINETYPVEGSWSHLASPLHNDGMRYYKFSEVLEKEDKADPVMNDKRHSNWYHSAAELPGSTPTKYKFRTMLYGEQYRDYTIEYNQNGKVTKTENTDTMNACRNLTGALDSPILSKDGTEVAGRTNEGTTIYKIKPDSTCEVVDVIPFHTSKVNFSYPKPPKKGQVVFKGNANIMVDGSPQRVSGVFLYDRDTKTTTRLSGDNDDEPSYPGMTKDGRVIYQNIGSREIVIVDPNQLNVDGTEKSDKSQCIQLQATGGSAGSSKSSGPVKSGVAQ